MLNVSIDQDSDSISTIRIAHALLATVPPWARIVRASADVQVLQATSLGARRRLSAPRYAVVQHALDFERGLNGRHVPIVVPDDVNPWEALWSRALAVWTYFDVRDRYTLGRPDPYGGWGFVSDAGSGELTPSAPQLYLAPLGVDLETFRPPQPLEAAGHRDVGIVTSGVLSGPTEEAIEEAAVAAHRRGLTTVHLGPHAVTGMTAQVPGWSAVIGISDSELATLYGRALWVSGLRHGEGFELPVLEGLACGARPICFDTATYRRWFSQHAVFVPESSGPELVDYLSVVMAVPPTPVTADELAEVKAWFEWRALAAGFWRALGAACESDGLLAPKLTWPVVAPPPDVKPAARARRRLLFIGDSPTTATGFGRATLNIARELLPRFDVTAIGTTHDGCPYDRAAVPYDVYPPVGNKIEPRLAQLLQELKPDVIVAQHDPWHVQNWLRDAGGVPVVGIMPIDGKNCRCDYLNGLALAVWWTQFAEREARLGGYVGESVVIPLGVDVETFAPRDKASARAAVGFPESVQDAFIVGVVARNQQRKRLDLTVRHFAEWVRSRGVSDAYLYVQAAATGEAAYDVASMMQYEKLSNRLILYQPKLRTKMSDQTMSSIYAALDVYFTTTQGEGWGLPPMEAMACGVPVVAPDWSALGEWARDAAVLVPCCDVAGTINADQPMSGVRIAVLGGVPDKAADVAALDRLYRDLAHREAVRTRALALVARPEYRWPAIGSAVLHAVEAVLDGRAVGTAKPLEVLA